MCRLRSGTYQPSLAERPFNLIHSLVRGDFRFLIGRLLGITYSPPGRHQPVDEVPETEESRYKRVNLVAHN